MKDEKSILLYVGFVFTIVGIGYLLEMIIPDSSYKALILRWSHTGVILLFASGGLLYSWRANMAELFERARIALPLGMAVSVLFLIMRFGAGHCIAGGLLTFVLLLFKTPNRKQHFTIIMTLALATVVAMKLSQVLSSAESKEVSFLEIMLPAICGMPIVFIFLFYMKKLEKGEEFVISSVILKAIKFFIAFGVFMASLFVLQDFSREREISPIVQMLLSVLMVIFSVWIGYVFDLMPDGGGEKKKRINELHEELEEFYLEEKAKLKERDLG